MTDYICQAKKEEEDFPVFKTVDAAIQQLEDYFQKRGVRLIKITKNNSDNPRYKRTTITRKLKWEENKSVDVSSD